MYDSMYPKKLKKSAKSLQSGISEYNTKIGYFKPNTFFSTEKIKRRKSTHTHKEKNATISPILSRS